MERGRYIVEFGMSVDAQTPGAVEQLAVETDEQQADPGIQADIAEAARNGERMIDALTNAAPMRRLGTPEDVAPAVAFLASDAAAFITGQTLSVSGGLTMA